MDKQDFLKASTKGELNTVQQFLSSKTIDVNTKNVLKSKTFMISKSSFLITFYFFNDLWDSIPTFDDTALILAAENGHKEIVRLLLTQEDININAKNIWNHNYS